MPAIWGWDGSRRASNSKQLEAVGSWQVRDSRRNYQSKLVLRTRQGLLLQSEAKDTVLSLQ
eukprot:2417934-Pleurochrysis_carterae.AAC.1